MMGYGERLRELRMESHMTQADLAEKVLVTRALIAQYEIGCRVPSLSTAERIADELGVSIDYMVKGGSKRCRSDTKRRPK